MISPASPFVRNQRTTPTFASDTQCELNYMTHDRQRMIVLPKKYHLEICSSNLPSLSEVNSISVRHDILRPARHSRLKLALLRRIAYLEATLHPHSWFEKSNLSWPTTSHSTISYSYQSSSICAWATSRGPLHSATTVKKHIGSA